MKSLAVSALLLISVVSSAFATDEAPVASTKVWECRFKVRADAFHYLHIESQTSSWSLARRFSTQAATKLIASAKTIDACANDFYADTNLFKTTYTAKNETQLVNRFVESCEQEVTDYPESLTCEEGEIPSAKKAD